MKNKLLVFALVLSALIVEGQDKRRILQFIFTSDAHYGIWRRTFRGDSSVSARQVNQAMIDQMNHLPGYRFPLDGGLQAGYRVGAMDFMVQGGDICNRMQPPVQSDSLSWLQFSTDYLAGTKLRGKDGKQAPWFLIPGNHDISNAIGFYKRMEPARDPTSMIGIYNLMMHPQKFISRDNFRYSRDRIHFSVEWGGIHFMFLNLWPDSTERIWMEKDLREVPSTEPVIIFTHDQPECEAKHFSNPDPERGINARDRFENLLDEVYKEGVSVSADGGDTHLEQIGWVEFLHRYPNIRAYFHGNSNYNEYYTYYGPDSSVSLPVFRVDSPMKGRYSSKNEKRLSFQIVTIDTKAQIMTVRECLWNSDPANPEQSIRWGAERTINLSVSRNLSVHYSDFH